MLRKKDIWNQITSSLDPAVSRSESETWFSHTRLKKFDPDLALVEVPNKFVASWLHEHYLSQIRNSFKNNLGLNPEIRFTYQKTSSDHYVAGPETTGKSDVIYNNHLNPSFTFDNFISAGSNEFAVASALQVASRPAEHYNPLYIFSPLSLGKTHLLNAIGNYLATKNLMTKVKYVSTDRFSYGLSSAIRKQKISEFMDSYRKIDFLLIDDIQRVAGREKTQEELTSLFNLFCETKKQIVVAGNSPPGQIRNLNTHLRSRMEWGLLVELHKPDQKTRMTIIKNKAREKDLDLPDDVAFFLSNSANDLKTLTKYLVSIETYKSLYQRQIDMSTVKSIIKTERLHNVSANDIQKLTAGYFNISISDILSNKKKRSFSYPRQISMYLTRKLTGLSYKEIGRAFGNKDHSTVIYAVKRIEQEKKTNRNVSTDIDKLQNFLS